mmetsp:Transcript_42965/g.93435  ORF Transcript_42965/g.93435 Transcript_42965/m.93435 type:complete len:242 (-) Transcript_42965:516-1241(-)
MGAHADYLPHHALVGALHRGAQPAQQADARRAEGNGYGGQRILRGHLRLAPKLLDILLPDARGGRLVGLLRHPPHILHQLDVLPLCDGSRVCVPGPDEPNPRDHRGPSQSSPRERQGGHAQAEETTQGGGDREVEVGDTALRREPGRADQLRGDDDGLRGQGDPRCARGDGHREGRPAVDVSADGRGRLGGSPVRRVHQQLPQGAGAGSEHLHDDDEARDRQNSQTGPELGRTLRDRQAHQ